MSIEYESRAKKNEWCQVNAHISSFNWDEIEPITSPRRLLQDNNKLISFSSPSPSPSPSILCVCIHCRFFITPFLSCKMPRIATTLELIVKFDITFQKSYKILTNLHYSQFRFYFFWNTPHFSFSLSLSLCLSVSLCVHLSSVSVKRIKEEENHRKDIIQWLLTSWNERRKKEPAHTYTARHRKQKVYLCFWCENVGCLMCATALSLSLSLVSYKSSNVCRNTYRRFGPWHRICIEIDIGVWHCVGWMLLLIRGWFAIRPAYSAIIVIIELSGYLGNNVNIIRIMITTIHRWRRSSSSSSRSKHKDSSRRKKERCNERARFECGLR